MNKVIVVLLAAVFAAAGLTSQKRPRYEVHTSYRMQRFFAALYALRLPL